MSRFVRALLRSTGALAMAVSIACAEPPSKEMSQAEGAIAAARAAGAAQYATTELDAATTALQASHQAASVRDFRLALNHALDSRERAENAAKLAVIARADARGAAERTLARIDAVYRQAVTGRAAAEARKVPARTLQAPVAALARTDKALQEARSALAREEYVRVIELLDGQDAQLRGTIEAFAAAVPLTPARRRR